MRRIMDVWFEINYNLRMREGGEPNAETALDYG